MEYINLNKKLSFIPEESESENESIKKSQEYFDSNSKDTNALWRGKSQEKKDTAEDKND